jgi:hypothetical protein
MAEYCSHGLIQREKLGTTVDENAVEICNGCGLPIWESARASVLATVGPGPGSAPTSPGQSDRDAAGSSIETYLGLGVVLFILGGIVATVGIDDKSVGVLLIGEVAAALGLVLVLIGVIALGVGLGIRSTRE